jgi:hypothetical protein
MSAGAVPAAPAADVSQAPRLPGTHRPGRVRRAGAVAAGILIVAGAALVLGTRGTGQPTIVIFAGLAFAVVPICMLISRRVEVSLTVMLLYLGLADGVLKLQSGSQFATLGRDALLYAIAIGMLLRMVVRGGSIRWPPLSGWILAWFAVVLVQLLNPEMSGWAHGIASLRQDLEFVPLFFIAAAVMTSIGRVRGFLLALLIVSAINGAVGLVQSTLSPDQLAHWGRGYADLINGTHGAPRLAVGANGEAKVRPPGLGGDMGFAGILGAIAIPGGLALLLSAPRGWRYKAMLAVLLVFAGLGPITSQSRSAVLTTITAVLAFMVMMGFSKQAKRALAGLAVISVFVIVAVLIVNGSGNTDAFYRYQSIAPTKVVGTTVDSRSGNFSLIPEYISQYPLGAGIGSTGPAYGQFGAPKHRVSGESQFTFLIVEVGVPGLALFLAFQASLLFTAVRGLRRLEDPEAQMLLAGVVAPLFGFVVNWIVGINTTSVPNAPYMWFATGIISVWLVRRRQRYPIAA